MAFDLIKALELANVPVIKGTKQTSTGTRLGRFPASYSSEGVHTHRVEALSPPDASEKVKQPVTEWEYTQAMNERINKANAKLNELKRSMLRGVERRLAIQNGEKVYTPPYKPPKLTEEQEAHRLALRAGAAQPQIERSFEYTKNMDEYKRMQAEFEFLKQERPWHAAKWPTIPTNAGGYISWSSCADPAYRDTETDFLAYARVYLERGYKEHRDILPVWVAGAKEVLGILELKEQQEAKRTEILIEGRQAGMKAMQVLAKTNRKNCTGTELDAMAKPELTQPLGMFVLSKKQQSMAESRNLMQHPVPYVDGLEYVAINWLLFDTARWLAYQELIRSPACAPRTYIDDNGVKRRLASGKVDKGTLNEVLAKKEG